MREVIDLEIERDKRDLIYIYIFTDKHTKRKTEGVRVRELKRAGKKERTSYRERERE